MGQMALPVFSAVLSWLSNVTMFIVKLPGRFRVGMDQMAPAHPTQACTLLAR